MLYQRQADAIRPRYWRWPVKGLVKSMDKLDHPDHGDLAPSMLIRVADRYGAGWRDYSPSMGAGILGKNRK